MGFDTSILDEALTKQRTNWEQNRQELVARIQAFLDEHAAQFGLEKVYIFGSLTKPRGFTDLSDIDVAVEQLPGEQYFKFAASLSASLGRDVDVIELNRCHFADKIRREGILWTPSA